MTTESPATAEIEGLADALAAAVSTPVLLVACDYDGTLAPIVDDPAAALPQRESIVALRALASLADTHVAVISGRALRDLAAFTRLPPEVHLVGSHGSEFEPGFATALPPESIALRDRLLLETETIARRYDGALVEVKPAAVAFHYRLIGGSGEQAVREVLEGPGRRHGVHVRHGKKVIELSVVGTDKGDALDRLRQQVGASAVVFVGDDLTDEDAFARLRAPDVSVKVGPGDSIASCRVADTDEVVRLLAHLVERRRRWLEGDATPDIEDHTLLSDHRTVALLTPDARLSWLCHPRADSSAIFAELLGGPTAGRFSVRPDREGPPLGQRYIADTFIVETRWPGLRVTDYLDVAHGRMYEPAGLSDLVRVLEGDAAVVVEFAPRLDFGRTPTQLEIRDDRVAVLGSTASIELVAPGVEWELRGEGPHSAAVARIQLRTDEPVVLELRLGGEHHAARNLSERERRAQTTQHWSSWTAGLQLPTVARGQVRRSALILKALCHQPSGAMLAAATTSLPEVLGGVRNWDYRYCWPRDASVAADALVRLGSTQEALALLDWLIQRVDRLQSADSLHPLYPLEGDEFVPEAVIPTLNGYRGSRPVRIGNLADHQLQLDMFGPVVQLVQRLCSVGVPITDRHWELVGKLAEVVVARWADPDNGIWEIRLQQRHHVHSKLMCWLTLDRAIAIADATGRAVPAHWPGCRDAIAADILEHGWNDRLGTFTAVYGGDEVDAAILAIATCGFLPDGDERVRATVTRIEAELRRREVVDRYHFADGLPGREGGFLLCTAWLIEALVAAGKGDDARQLFGAYLDLTGPTGMLPEQYDPVTETALGNVPQAYSHAGLIVAALAVASVG